MRILVLGGDGMLGHQLLQQLAGRHDVRVTLRQDRKAYSGYGLFDASNSYPEVDGRDIERIGEILTAARPEAVINALGIIKQRQEASQHIPTLEINALLPHKLAELCNSAGARLVQISTDCVFSGKQGNYTEDASCDAQDLYGMTKFLGELRSEEGITLRTSYFGLELSRKAGLIEWFLAQTGEIRGFRRAIYSGLTTMEIARVVERVLTTFPALSGLWHVASEPIDKFTLLSRLAEKLGRTDLTVVPDDEIACDRSLDSTRFRGVTDYSPPEWEVMLDELSTAIQHRETRQ